MIYILNIAIFHGHVRLPTGLPEIFDDNQQSDRTTGEHHPIEALRDGPTSVKVGPVSGPLSERWCQVLRFPRSLRHVAIWDSPNGNWRWDKDPLGPSFLAFFV